MRDRRLHGEKVLFIAPVYYDYHIVIKKELQKRGATVVFFPEKPNTVYERLIKYLFQKKYRSYYDTYENRILHRVKDISFNRVLVIRAEMLSSSFFKKLRMLSPKAVFTLYQWDSLRNNNYYRLIDSFDHVFSFDYVDTRNNEQLIYCPLFAENSYYSNQTARTKYDLCYISSFQEQRYYFLQALNEVIKTNHLALYKHLYIPFFTWLKKLFEGNYVNLKDISFFKLDTKSVVSKIRASRAVLDVNNCNQSGLSIRVLEAIAMKKKVITTNENIVCEEIIPDGVYRVIKKDFNKFDFTFLKSSNSDFKFNEEYTINKWIDKVLFYQEGKR